jgi:hypothetical protein
MPPDPWCADVYVKREPGPLYVAVRYQEVKSRPVRVPPAGCGCDDTQCEYSRCRDGYEVCVLTDCPPSHDSPPDFEDLLRGPIPECPECPIDPWVVLARVEIDADGTITLLDNCSCRRLAVSFGHTWWRCTTDACAIQSVDVEGGRRVEAGRAFVMNIRGYDLPAAVKVNLGDKVTVNSAVVSEGGTRLQIKAKAEADAEPGPRALEIRDAVTDRLIAASRDVVVIRSPGAAAPRQAEPTPEKQAQPGKPRGKGKTGGG